MELVLSVDLGHGPTGGPLTEDLAGMAERALHPFAGDAGLAAIGIMRFGEGSIEQQFAAESQFILGSEIPWPATQAFGILPPPSHTLYRSGLLESAWLGGAGTEEFVADDEIFIGVDTARFPGAALFQADTPQRIFPQTQTRDGRYAMQVFLGLEYGVWMSEAHIALGILILPRPIGIGSRMFDRMISFIEYYLDTGQFLDD